MAGIQKWALVAYVGLCIFLLARPSTEKLMKRAEALDNRLNSANKELVGPALAEALEIPADSLSAFLQDFDSKPSSLVFRKLLQNCGSENCEEADPQGLAKAGVPVDDALLYFDRIEEKVMARLEEGKSRKPREQKPFAVRSTPADVHASRVVRSQPD